MSREGASSRLKPLTRGAWKFGHHPVGSSFSFCKKISTVDGKVVLVVVVVGGGGGFFFSARGRCIKKIVRALSEVP